MYVCLSVFPLNLEKYSTDFQAVFDTVFRYCIWTQLQSDMGDMIFLKSVSFAHRDG